MTAGNASGVNDGAAILVLASEDGIRRHGLQPKARLVSVATVGVAPGSWGLLRLPPRRNCSSETLFQ